MVYLEPCLRGAVHIHFSTYVCVCCLLSRVYACAWISSSTLLWGIGPSSSASSCCCTSWRKTFLLLAGSSLSTALKHYLWRLSYTWTATRSSLSLLVRRSCVLIQSFTPAPPSQHASMRLTVPRIKSVIFLLTAITAVRTNVANLSDAAMWKIRRARFARNRQKSVRSLRDSVKGGPTESKRAFSLPESLSNRLREYHSSASLSDFQFKSEPVSLSLSLWSNCLQIPSEALRASLVVYLKRHYRDNPWLHL